MNSYSIWMSDLLDQLLVPLRVVSGDPVPCEPCVNGSLQVSDPFLFAPLPSLYTTTIIAALFGLASLKLCHSNIFFVCLVPRYYYLPYSGPSPNLPHIGVISRIVNSYARSKQIIEFRLDFSAMTPLSSAEVVRTRLEWPTHTSHLLGNLWTTAVWFGN